MTDDTTTPREGTPDPSGPEELETTAADTDSTQVLEQSAPTSELPSLTPEVLEAPPSPEASPVAPTTVTPASPDATPVTPTPPAAVVAPAPGGLVTVRTGPRPGAILLGLLCLLVAGYTTARQTMDWRLDLDLVGPVSIGVLGALLLLVGLIGMLSRRRS